MAGKESGRLLYYFRTKLFFAIVTAKRSIITYVSKTQSNKFMSLCVVNHLFVRVIKIEFLLTLSIYCEADRETGVENKENDQL